MTKTLTRKVKHQVEDTLEDVATSLRQAADGLSDDAEKALAQAAQALRVAAEALTEDTEKAVAEKAKSLRQVAHRIVEKTPLEARYLAAKAAKEVKEHPIASTAAALSAAAALITLLGIARKKSG